IAQGCCIVVFPCIAAVYCGRTFPSQSLCWGLDMISIRWASLVAIVLVIGGTAAWGDSATDLLARGRMNAESGKYAEAAQVYRVSLNQSPRHAEAASARLRLGLVERALGLAAEKKKGEAHFDAASASLKEAATLFSARAGDVDSEWATLARCA